ncbi:hypothetical protein RF11_00442 [Thelohanellus kitauei]|uniref:Uncharacterized protein n=1 Tax=Thelohanellus kitauei TaxID=669202 RepID=A0A0C2N5N1_THEKT|nr:hypothetical protein RF11_00442 [Thelohanellus kitauei]
MDDSKLTIKFESESDQWSEIICELLNSDNELQINKCVISFKLYGYNDVISFMIGYTFKLDKKTKYVFSEHMIRINIHNKIGHRIKFKVDSLLITFHGYTRTYTWKNAYMEFLEVKSESSTIIDDFANYGGSYSVEGDPSNTIKVDEMPIDDITNDTDEIRENKGFWTSKKILVAIISSVSVIITFITIIIIISKCKISGYKQAEDMM